MSRVTFIFSSGRTVVTHEAQARLLKRMGKGDYITRDMADQPTEAKTLAFPGTSDDRTVEEVSEYIISQNASNSIDFDGMTRDELYTLAKERGLNVHHRAGADKLREALRATA